MLELIWLGVVLIGLAVWTLIDRSQYRVFKTAEETGARQRFYLQWTVQGLVLLVGASAVTSWVLGRDLPLQTVPLEFQSLAAALQPPSLEGRGADGQIGLVIGLAIGLTLAIGIQIWRMKRALKTVVGDVEALVPRNRREALAALPLCIGAGVGEELFFRLALPLLIAGATGSVIFGFAASAVIFGLIHAYQGWKGVLATTLAGVFLTYVYLSSGSIVRAMVLHAVMDILALFVRPLISRCLSSSGDRG